jgi:UDP-N-acetyl-D-mannosaminuronic acid transferase (WecB/TagA/CpsF family)
MAATQQILGINFFNGDVDEVVGSMCRDGGFVVVPAAPAMVKLRHSDKSYRRALTSADVAIADSGLMVSLWRIFKGRPISRISGLKYLTRLICQPTFQSPGMAFFVLPTDKALRAILRWSAGEPFRLLAENCYVAPLYGSSVEDRELLDRLELRKPSHIVIAIGNGPQEKLGLFLRETLSYRPAIHCIGAALGFLTGDQVAIPDWADRFYLGWLFRLFAQPGVFIPRLTRALELPWLLLRYGRELPPLRRRQRSEIGDQRSD